MDKNFDGWNITKKKLDSADPRVSYKEREIWWMKLGVNIGSEQNGSIDTFSRPVLIVRGFSRNLLWGLPLSNTANRGSYIHPLSFKGSERAINLSQIRAIDTRRLGSKVGMISIEDMRIIKRRLSNIILE